MRSLVGLLSDVKNTSCNMYGTDNNNPESGEHTVSIMPTVHDRHRRHTVVRLCVGSSDLAYLHER